MNARVGKSTDISHSLGYAQNREKDGGILLANFTDIAATPEVQARDWMATANDYKTRCYTIIISFTPTETAMLRSMPDNGRDKIRTIIRDFLDELSERGNDVTECPYIVRAMTIPTTSTIISLSAQPTLTVSGFATSSSTRTPTALPLVLP